VIAKKTHSFSAISSAVFAFSAVSSYSFLSASTGSSAEARRAGRMLAVRAIAINKAVTPPKAAMSNAETPYNTDRA
jgi:hypothetical protein